METRKLILQLLRAIFLNLVREQVEGIGIKILINIKKAFGHGIGVGN